MKFLPLLTGIVATSLFLAACGKKDEVEVLPSITKNMIPAEMPPMPTSKEMEKEKLESYCANVAFFPNWDAEGKCDELKKPEVPDK